MNRFQQMKTMNPNMVITENMNIQERVDVLQGGPEMELFLRYCEPSYLSFLLEDLDFFDLRGSKLQFFIKEICNLQCIIALRIFWAISTNLITQLALDIAIEEQDPSFIPIKYIIKQMDKDLQDNAVMAQAAKVAQGVISEMESGRVGFSVKEFRERLKKDLTN